MSLTEQEVKLLGFGQLFKDALLYEPTTARTGTHTNTDCSILVLAASLPCVNSGHKIKEIKCCNKWGLITSS